MIKQVMTRMPYTISKDLPALMATKIMGEYGVRHLPVVENGKIVGMVSDRDVRSAASFRGSRWLSVGEAMSAEPYVVSPDTPVDEVLSEMIKRKIGSAVVVNPAGKTIGIFTESYALLELRDALKSGH